MRELNNWIESYMKYTLHTESPDLFHKWTAISCIAAALGRRVWIDRGAYRIYPNHYIIIVAGTAQCRKSTAVRIGRDLIRTARVTNISAERITDALLWKQLGDMSKERGSAEMFTFVDELKNYLKAEDAYRGVIVTLTTLFLCPDEIESGTKGAGVDSLKNPCLNILAATTPKDFSEIIPGGSAESGFIPRLHIIHQEVPRPRISMPSLDRELEPKLVNDLKHIHELKGEIRLSPKARAWFDYWYEKEFTFPEDERLDGFYGRKHDYVLKLGIILSVARCDALVVEQEDLLQALEWLDEIETFMPSMYEGVEVTPTLKYADSVLKHITMHKEGVTWADLLRVQGRRLDSGGLAEVCRFLEASNKVEGTPGKNGTRYKVKRRAH